MTSQIQLDEPTDPRDCGDKGHGSETAEPIFTASEHDREHGDEVNSVIRTQADDSAAP